jgi:hypothetical protein
MTNQYRELSLQSLHFLRGAAPSEAILKEARRTAAIAAALGDAELQQAAEEVVKAHEGGAK